MLRDKLARSVKSPYESSEDQLKSALGRKEPAEDFTRECCWNCPARAALVVGRIGDLLRHPPAVGGGQL
jgi:hypothetical protein